MIYQALRVVEISANGAAAWAGKHFADLGADVTILESPGGSPLREAPPYYESGGVRRSATWAWLSRGKRTVVVGGPGGPTVTEALAFCQAADVVLVEREVTAAVLGLQPHEVASALAGRATCVLISPFSTDGPRADYRATDLGIQAASGWCNIIGDPDREPLRPGCDLSPRISGLWAFVAALTALRHRRLGGAPQHIDLSMQAASAAVLAGPWLMKSMMGVERNRKGNWWPLGGVMPCSDGWLGCTPLTATHWEMQCQMMGIADILEEPGGLDPQYRETHAGELLERMRPWLSAHTKLECFEQAQTWRIPAAPVQDVAERLACPQLAARGFWVEAEIDGHTVKTPRRAYLVEGVPPAARGPLVEVATVAAPDPASHSPTTGRPTRPEGARPFDGVRILDLTHFWSGPSATMLLGALGADVIKVETTRRPDPYRFSVAPAGTDHWWERGAYWNDTNAGKRGITLDLDQPRGRELLARLVEQSDVVMSNFSNRVMGHLGFDAVALHAINPRVIVATLPGYGPGGPWEDYVGYGLAFEQLAVSASITGYPGGAPRFVGGFGDPVSGLHMVAAIEVALLHRERTGLGNVVEVPQCEVLDSLYAPEQIAVQHGQPVPGLRANRHESMAPHNAYRVAGDDRWVTLAIANDDEFAALCRVLDATAIATDPRFATANARKLNEDALDAELAPLLEALAGETLETELQAAGVACLRLAKGWELPADPDLRGIGFFQLLERPYSGAHEYKTWPFRFSAIDTAHRRPPPLLGEHTAEVLSPLLGLGHSDLAQLEEDGVVGTVPRGL